MVRPVIGTVVAVIIVPVVVAAQRGPNQFAIGKAFLIGGLIRGRMFGWYGVESFFHMSPPAHGGGKNATTHELAIVGLKRKLMRYGTTAN